MDINTTFAIICQPDGYILATMLIKAPALPARVWGFRQCDRTTGNRGLLSQAVGQTSKYQSKPQDLLQQYTRTIQLGASGTLRWQMFPEDSQINRTI